MVQAQHSVRVGLGNHLGQELGVLVIEVHVPDHKQVALELVVLLAPKQTGSNEEKFQLFEFIELENPHFFIVLLVGTQKSPPQLRQSPYLLHLADPESRVLGHDYGSPFDLLMEDMDQPREGVEGNVGQSAEIVTFLEPLANVLDFFGNLHQRLPRGGRLCGDLVVSSGLVLLKEIFKVLIQTNFEEGLLEESTLDGLIHLEVKVFADDVCQFVGRVGIEVLLFLDHDSNQNQLKLIVGSGYFVMEFGQSRSTARGPLIAVIKIEIDSQRTDRIFLHQRDNDFKLAQQFVEKHKLNHALTQHIYERVKFSRESVEKLEQEAVSPNPGQYQELTPTSHNDYKLHTPINHVTHGHDPFSEDQSFGNTNLFSDRFKRPEEVAISHERHRETRFSGPNPKYQPPAPSKQQAMKGKQFLIYGKQNQEEEQGTQVNLFGTRPNNSTAQGASTRKQIEEYMIDRGGIKNSEKKSRNAMDIICQQERQNVPLRTSKSMMKLSQHKESLEVQDIFEKIAKPTTNFKLGYDKPSRVKILKKQEIESLNQSIKKSMSKQEISRINRDVTKRLYNEANIKKNYLHIIKEKAKKDKEMQEDQELTLKPQINRVSRVIAEARKKTDVPIEDYLIEEGKKAETKRAQCNSKRLIDQLEQCSFKPTLNLISQKLAADKDYLQSRIRQHSSRRSRYKDQNTFRPSLNKITHELMKGKGSFQERQKQYLQLKNEKLMAKVNERLLGERIDLETGQKLFKPMINDMGVRESQGTNIGAYLYHLSREVPENMEGKAAHPRISQSSQSMVEQMYMRRITWLFSELDSDQDGIISAQKICIDTIDPDILSIIKPILFEMQEINEQLSLLEFKNAIEILHKKLNVSEKSILYNNKPKCK